MNTYNNNGELIVAEQPYVLYGNGNPIESNVPLNWQQYNPETDTGYNWIGEPSVLGQKYIDQETGNIYLAIPGSSSYTLIWQIQSL